MECRLPLIEWQYWSYTCKSRYIFLFSKFALSLSIIQKFKDEGKSSNYWHPRNFLPWIFCKRCMYTIVLVQMLKNSGDSSGYQNYKCTEKHSVTKQMIYVTCDLLKLSITLRKMLLNIIRKFSSGRHNEQNRVCQKRHFMYTWFLFI